jgi:hypothetical protein
MLTEGMASTLESEVDNYLHRVRNDNAMYEGVIAPSNKPPGSNVSGREEVSAIRIVKSLIRAIRNDIIYWSGDFRYDNWVSSSIGYLYHQKVMRPMIARRMSIAFRNIYLDSTQLESMSFAFFPLHTEPEVTLSVYSKPYMNQIEAIRLISHNLPVGMQLVVKEHPVSVGKRKFSYYKKLLEIPNVLLAPPEMKSRDLIDNADLITVISGSIGLEGLFMKVPVIVLGSAPFNFLPTKMMRRINNPDTLGFEIRDLLNTHEHDEQAIKCYVGATMQDSVPLDFYSILSGRKEAYRDGPSLDDVNNKIEYKTQVNKLAEYLIRRFNNYKS